MAHDHVRHQTDNMKVTQSRTTKSSTLSHLHLGSWNIRSCQHPDKLDCILDVVEYTELHLCVLCETWMDSRADLDQFEHHCAQRGYTTFSSTRTGRSGGGVSVLFKSNLFFSLVKASTSHTHNYIWINTRIDGKYVYLLCTYIPPSTSKQADFDTFLAEINQDVSIFSISGEILILGDLNLKVGNLSQTFEHKHSNITLPRTLKSDTSDGRGKQFISFSNTHKLVIINGVGNHTDSYTYLPIKRTSAKRANAQGSTIDYIVCSYDVYHKLSPLRAWPPSTTHYFFKFQHTPPDHLLISTRLIIHDVDVRTTPINKHQPRIRLMTSWSRHRLSVESYTQWTVYREMVSAFCTQIQRHIQSPWFQNINNLCNTLIAKISDAGRLSRVLKSFLVHLNVTNYTKPLYPPAIQEALRRRKDALSLVILSQHEAKHVQTYRQTQHQVKREFRAYYLEQEQHLYSELHQTRTHDAKYYWKVIKKYYSPYSPRSSTYPSMLVFDDIQYRGPDLLTKLSQEHKANFATKPNDGRFDVYEYTRSLQIVSTEEQRVPRPAHPDPLLEENFSWEEMERVITSMKRHKACDKDYICAEALIHGGLELHHLIHHLCKQAWSEEKIPDSWRESRVLHIHKGGETTEHKNWRPISIISVLSKVYLELLRGRLEKHVESKNILPDEQYAFRKNRGCEDCVFLLNSFLQHKRNRRENAFVLFIDFTKAYDKVFRTGLWAKLLKYGINGKMWRVLRDIYTDSKSRILHDDEVGLPFVTEEGLRQGCLLSTLLFSLYITDLVELIKQPGIGIQLRDLHLTMTKFADDIALYAESVPDLQRLVEILVEYCYVNRMEISIPKTKAMYFRFGSLETLPNIKIYGHPVEIVAKFKYLGVYISQDLSYNYMREQALKKAQSRRSCELAHAISKNLPTRSIIEIFRTLVLCCLDYCFGIWGTDKWKDADRFIYQTGISILGCPTKLCPNAVAVLGELGLHTMKSRLTQLQLRYYRKVLMLDNNCMLFRTLQRQKEVMDSKLYKAADTNWYSMVTAKLQEMKLQHIAHLLTNQDSVARREMAKQFKHKKVSKQFGEALWRDTVNRSSRLSVYKLVKTALRCEPYLLLGNRSQTTVLTKLRLGCHDLFVLTGKYETPTVPHNERLCLFCPGSLVEDETHVLLHCTAYDHLRSSLFDKIRAVSNQKIDPWLMTHTDCLSLLLTGGFPTTKNLKKKKYQNDICSIITSYIHQVFCLRTDLMRERDLAHRKFHRRSDAKLSDL